MEGLVRNVIFLLVEVTRAIDVLAMAWILGISVRNCAAVMLGMKGVVSEMMRVSRELHAIRGAHGIPLLSHAIFGGEASDDVFEMLLDAGADVNAKSNLSMTPLMAAASVGRVSQVEVLLAKGAEPDVADSKGRTALDVARKREKHHAAKLIERALSR